MVQAGAKDVKNVKNVKRGKLGGSLRYSFVEAS
jgi:hypothetical protein